MMWQQVLDVGQSDVTFRIPAWPAFPGRIWRQTALLLLAILGMTTAASWWRGHPADAVRAVKHPDASQMALAASYRAFPGFPGALAP